MRSRFYPIVRSGVFACILLWAGQLFAGEYTPVKWGSFLLTPKLTIEQSFNDNIFATDDDAEADYITALKPSLLIQKTYRDHEFALEAKGEALKYWENSDEDVINFKSEFRGKVVVRRVLTLPFKLSYESAHHDRQEERGVFSREPTGFKLLKTEIGADYKPSRLGIGIYTGYNQIRHDNGESFTGAPIINEDSDYDSLYARIVARYETKADWTPFASLQIGKNDFLRRTHDGAGFNGLKRDNRVIRALMGAEFNDHEMWKGSAAIGHDWRKYDDGSIDDIAALSAEGNIEWAPTRKLNLVLNFLRQSEEDSIVDRGMVQTDVKLGVRYELQQNIYLHGNTEWKNTEYESIDRTDDLYGAGFGVSYVLNRRLEAGASYLHHFRESSQAGSDFDSNVFMLRLTGKL